MRLGAGAGGALELEVCDNGPGFAPQLQATMSFDRQLMQVLSQQLGASLTLFTTVGTYYLLRIPEAVIVTDQVA